MWAGISLKGPTKICIFEGIMDGPLFTEILESTLLPFIEEKFPCGHRFMQDNDPKHTSRVATSFYTAKGINWWRTPAESPDLNPVENCWGSLKQFLRSSYKPSNLQELIDGIEEFWQSLTPEVCKRYIQHLQM